MKDGVERAHIKPTSVYADFKFPATMLPISTSMSRISSPPLISSTSMPSISAAISREKLSPAWILTMPLASPAKLTDPALRIPSGLSAVTASAGSSFNESIVSKTSMTASETRAFMSSVLIFSISAVLSCASASVVPRSSPSLEACWDFRPTSTKI